MDQKTKKLYPSAPLLRSDQNLEQSLEMKLNDVNSFNNSIINIKEMITHFKDKNNKSKKKFKNYTTLTTKLKSFDTFVTTATSSSFFTLSFTGIGSPAVAITTATACRLSVGNNVIYEIIKNKYNK